MSDQAVEQVPRAGSTAERRRLWRRRLRPYAFMAPAIVLLGVIFVLPVGAAVRDSFTSIGLITQVSDFIGLENYRTLLDIEFPRVVLRTVLWVGLTVAGSCAAGFLVAVLLDKPMPGRWFFRLVMILPWVFPESISAIMWRWTLHPRYGILNNLLVELGILDSGIDFFSPERAFVTALILNIWRSTPFVFLTVLAGLQAIDPRIEEAARVDAATPLQSLRHITWPLMKPVLGTSAVILSAWTMVNFDMIFVLTGGGPDGATEILAVSIYNAGFQDFNLGLASAMATITVALVMGFGYFYVKNAIDDAVTTT